MTTAPDLAVAFRSLSTPLIADACLRAGLPVNSAPPGIAPVVPGMCAAGRVLPARHYGSVDVFLEAMETAEPGDVLVVDNEGRTDEACIGDLTVHEARSAGLGGMLVWGLHRDTAELREIEFPVFTYGACPTGPQRLDPSTSEALVTARFGSFLLGREHAVFADDDGVVFAPWERLDELLGIAKEIGRVERAQAAEVASGNTLRDQLRFRGYLERREREAGFTFRQHLREIGGAIEE